MENNSKPLINSNKKWIYRYTLYITNTVKLVPLSHKILTFSWSTFAFTLFLINRQRHSPFILSMASDHALAGRALLLGTALSVSGVGGMVGLIGTVMGVSSFLEFRTKVDRFFIENGIKRPHRDEDEIIELE